MPSPVERDVTRIRIWLERGAQALALAIVAWLLYDALRPRDRASVDVVNVRQLPGALRRWSTVASPTHVHARLDSALGSSDRDWLSALASSGVRVSWDGQGVVPLAAVAEAVADPAGGTRVWAAAPRGAPVVLEDAFGLLDSASANAGGARFFAGSPIDLARVQSGVLTARSAPPDSLGFGRVLLLGQVGWEAKFVAAALEERGWKVDARLPLTAKQDVVQGPQVQPDTARYSAVVVLDESALASVSSLGRYVRDGGGLIVAASAGNAPTVAALRAGAPGKLVPAAEPFDSTAAEPRRALALTPVALRPDAVPLERRDAQVAVAARRVGRGRVVSLGYEDTWRWRMGGNAAALEAHRAWWAALVAGVAHVSRTPRTVAANVDEAPYVSLLARLGNPAAPPTVGTEQRRVPDGWMLAIFSAALLGAWLSRRLRGAA